MESKRSPLAVATASALVMLAVPYRSYGDAELEGIGFTASSGNFIGLHGESNP